MIHSLDDGAGAGAGCGAGTGAVRLAICTLSRTLELRAALFALILILLEFMDFYFTSILQRCVGQGIYICDRPTRKKRKKSQAFQLEGKERQRKCGND